MTALSDRDYEQRVILGGLMASIILEACWLVAWYRAWGLMEEYEEAGR